MAQASKAKRRMRRLKRANTVLNRNVRQGDTIDYLRGLLANMQKMVTVVRTTLLAVLAQGGDTVITKGTVEQVVNDLQHLDFTTEENKETGEVVVRLVDARNAVPEEEPVTISGGDDYPDHDHDHEVSRFADEGCPHV